ncbi:hypothetical protein M9H77_12718 [Catharanthus roseus]|uniref:Uncharacterized protein n=1 Tax=Catharanthus roseus TaxID=4058 RepID=A0ACC0BIC8_CATRO|nr:hypothetical protein M9H77_12718 [Catharanthus roseus]
MRENYCDISSSLTHVLRRRIQSQFLNFLTTTFGTKPNHGMKAKEKDMGKEHRIGIKVVLRVVYLLCDFGWKCEGIHVSLFCGKKTNGSFKVLKVHPCDLVKTTFENGVSELALKDLDEKIVYPIPLL